MQTTGIILKTDTDINTRKLKISLLVDVNNKEVVEQLKSENKLCIELKKWRQKRSLDANSYCWVLCDKIAKELCKDRTIVTKEDVYKDAIYNTKEMSLLIEDLIELAKTLNVETKSQSEINSLLKEWDR